MSAMDVTAKAISECLVVVPGWQSSAKSVIMSLVCAPQSIAWRLLFDSRPVSFGSIIFKTSQGHFSYNKI